MDLNLERFPIVEETQIKYFTTSDYIRNNFIPQVIQPVYNVDEADILLFENQIDTDQTSTSCQLVISLNPGVLGCDCIIEKGFVLQYLVMLDKMKSEVGFVGMADQRDVLSVTRGSLYYYSQYDFQCSVNDLIVSLPVTMELDEVGIIIYLSQNDCVLLSRISEFILERYTKSNLVMMQPSMWSDRNESKFEIFIFKW